MNVQNLILIFLIIVLIIILLVIINIKNLFENVSDSTKKTWIFVFSVLGGLFVIMSIFLPYWLTSILSKESLEPNAVGDTIGGTMGPFVAIGGVIFTFLAFYMQKLANDEIKNQFKIQQFESQFYEMLRLHKENVNEVEIYAKRKNISSEITTAAAAGLNIENYYEFSDYIVSKRNAFVEMQRELEFMIEKLKISDTPNLDFTMFQNIYKIFFWGLSGYDTLATKIVIASSTNYNDILYLIQQSQYSRNIFSFNEDISFDIPAFKGHSNFLGHYYRHLFHTVKFVVYYDEKILDEDNKIKYLRLLRAQLSNHEQALLFYNWIATYGEEWEDENNFFLSKYKMIHNLWYENLPQEEFIKEKLKFLVNNYKSFGFKDSLFESRDVKIEDY